MSDSPPEPLFSEARRWQSWLDVEAALARVQARAGIIPDWAAQDITEAARLDRLDRAALRADMAETMAPVHSLARFLAQASGDAGAWVHWGATTQNIIDTGQLLILREAQAHLRAHIATILNRLADLADRHAQTAMVGRTNRQHALPITFGFKVAGWIDEMLRVTEALQQSEARLFVLRFGGAIGTYQSFGDAGPALAEALARELGLTPSRHAGRAQVDFLIEHVTRLGMLGVAAGRIGSEAYAGMQSDIAELGESLGPGVVGSSTMPHKVNPKRVVSLIANATRLRSKGAAAFAVTPPAHEGDAVTNSELRALLEDTVPLALTVAEGLEQVLHGLTVNTDAMATRLAASGDMMALEAIMMHLAPTLGRGAAHDALHAAADQARSTGEPLRAVLRTLPEVADALDDATLSRLLDPGQNTGQSVEIARQAARDARDCAAGLTGT